MTYGRLLRSRNERHFDDAAAIHLAELVRGNFFSHGEGPSSGPTAHLLPKGRRALASGVKHTPLLRRGAPEHLDVGLLLVGLEVQRAAAEGREAGAEDHPGVDEVATLDDLLVAHALVLADQRIDQLAAQPLQFELVVGLLGNGLLRLALLPDVE